MMARLPHPLLADGSPLARFARLLRVSLPFAGGMRLRRVPPDLGAARRSGWAAGLSLHGLLVIALWFGLGWAAEAQAQQAALPAFEIVVRDGVFDPPRLEVPAGTRVKLSLVNEGPGPLEFENDEMHIEKILGPGGRSFVVLPKLAPGEYGFVDEFNPITGELVIIAK